MSTNTGSNYDAGYFEIQVDFGDKSTYAPWTNYTFKVVLTDDAATDPTAIEVSDEWMVHIYDLCWRNQLTLTSASDNGDVTHQMDQDGTSTATTISQIAFTST